MGSWTCLGVTKSNVLLKENYGTTFQVRFRLKYTTGRGSYTEMPRLEWKETILMMNHGAGEWWVHSGDQYARNPKSVTFKTWGNRYITACDSVWYQEGPGYAVKLYDVNGRPLPKTALGATKHKLDKAKADAVRTYLMSHGGIMEVEITDKPAILRPEAGATVHKERLLTFDCGLRGMGPRVKAYQYIHIDSSTDASTWKREVVYSDITPPYSTAGLTKVAPGDDVTVLRPAVDSPVNGFYL